MAIFLRDLYYDTKRKYNLNLISGGKGMENIVSWVYISEDISTSTFLNGGELIITTGVTSGEREDWLRAFIKELIKRGTCGLILNTGRYIFEEDITDEIVRLCHRYSFPLFTMPWDTRIFDITHDYYNRIFEDSRDDGNMTAAFQNILMGNSLTDEQADTLRGSGFNNGCYNVLSIDTEATDEFMYILQKVCNNADLVFHAFVYDGNPTVILRCPSSGSIADKCSDIAEALAARFPDYNIHMGSGSPVLSLTDVAGYAASKCEEKKIAKAAAKLIYAFHDMTAPKVNVIVGAANGTASLAMNNSADMTYAWPQATIGMMDPVSAAKIMYADEIAKADDKNALISEKAAAYAKLQASAESAAKRGYVDSIIAPETTRQIAAAAFEMLFTKREDRPAKKHGTV